MAITHDWLVMSKFSILSTTNSVSLLFVALYSSALFAAHLESGALSPKTLEIQTIEYPPFMMRKNIVDSVITPIYDDVFDKSGFNYRLLFNPLPRVNLIVKEGHWCSTNIAPVTQMDNIVSITLPFAPLELRLYRLAKNSRFYWKELNELKGKKLAILRSRNVKSVMVYSKAGIELIKTNNIKQSFSLLLLGRVDYILTNELTSRYIVNELAKTYDQIQKSENVLITIQPKLWFNLNCGQAKAAYNALKSKYPNL